MSYLVTAPELMASAATDLSNIGSAVTSANVAAAAQTTKLLAATEDEVSAAVASLFSGHGQAFQALSAQAAVVHSKFVQALNSAGSAYAAAEAANASPLQAVVQVARINGSQAAVNAVIWAVDEAMSREPGGTFAR